MERLVLDEVTQSMWDDFHAGRAASLPAKLATCWTRARTLGAPPDGAAPEDKLMCGEQLRLHQEHVELIQALGDSILDRATARVADRDFLLLLADPDGVVVRTSGGGQFSETATRVRLIAGANWSEAARGTNAIGTAVAENRPTEVHGHAHFGRSYGELVCYAAPVRGVDGRPLAVLDATSRVERADPEIARTIVQTARSLESLLRLQAYASAGVSMTRVLGRSIERMRDPAMWIESPGRIVRANAMARELLGDQLPLPWPELMRASLSGDAQVTIGRNSWRLRLEPMAAPDGVIIGMLAVLEQGRVATTRKVVDAFAPIFAEDAATLAAIDWSRRLAASDVPVMLLAETGAGKELFAQAIHAASPRAAGPFHAINCGAIAPSLLEAELFGYAGGAFTGAERGGRRGLFHAASGGTLFLDEVAEMSPQMQAALLRVLESGQFRRVGETRLERCDVRIACATCRDLPALVASGAFRQDLYYRLKGATVRIPALRERTDVVALAEHLLGRDAALDAEAAAVIARHPWPGNVRELKSTLAVARVSGDRVLTRAHLPPEMSSEVVAGSGIDDAEKAALVRALAEARGNVSQAARALGVARSTAQRMMKKYRLT